MEAKDYWLLLASAAIGVATSLIATFAAPPVGSIASAQQHSDMRGAGLASCAEYAADYRRSPVAFDNIYCPWAQGFITGVNATRANDFKTTDEMKRLLRQYCSAHPLANYMDGVVELMKSLPIVKRKDVSGR